MERVSSISTEGYPKRYTVHRRTFQEERNVLLVEMFHGGGAEDDEEAHPERGALKGNRLVVFAVFLFVLIRFEDDGIEEQCKKT